MADVQITVDAGVCRFKTVITAVMDDEMNITYKVKSECPAVREMAKNMRPIGIFEALAKPFPENVVYNEFGNYLEHSACPVPCALIKAAEVASDMALKKNVTFTIE